MTLQLVEEPQTVEQRAIAAAAPMDAKRFSVVLNTGTDVDDSPNAAAGEKVGFNFLFESTRCTHANLYFSYFIAQTRCFRIG